MVQENHTHIECDFLVESKLLCFRTMVPSGVIFLTPFPELKKDKLGEEVLMKEVN